MRSGAPGETDAYRGRAECILERYAAKVIADAEPAVTTSGRAISKQPGKCYPAVAVSAVGDRGKAMTCQSAMALGGHGVVDCKMNDGARYGFML